MKPTSFGFKIGICKPVVLPFFYTVNGDPTADFQTCYRVGAQADSYVGRKNNIFNENKKSQTIKQMACCLPPKSACFI